MTIRPYPKNAKKHTKKQIDAIARSIQEYGFNQPIVVDKKGVIIVGHGRFEAAKLLGIKDIPHVVADLPPKKAAAYRLADNKLNESEWDMNLVLEEVRKLGEDASQIIGFDIKKITREFLKKGTKKNIKVVAKAECPKCGHKFEK